MKSKNLIITYILWLFGGIFGLHHFYLGRDYHALLWWMTLGGYCGIGWLRDLWRIPEYVKDANNDPEYIARLSEQMRTEDKPSSGFLRYMGMLSVADTIGLMVVGAIPKELLSEMCLKLIVALLAPFGSALGVYLVGNIGRHEGRLMPALIAAYSSFPLYFIMDTPVFISSLIATNTFNSRCKQWRRTQHKKSLYHRITFYIFFGSLYLLLWSSWLYFNCQLTYENENEVKCRDAAKHFFKSPIWKEFIIVMKELWKNIQLYGWREVWEHIKESFDPVGKFNALKVLGLHENATQQEISSRYRKLSKEWHPDKHKDPEAKRVAEEKFIEIQQAYEILSQIKSQRVVQNIKNPTDNKKEKNEL